MIRVWISPRPKKLQLLGIGPAMQVLSHCPVEDIVIAKLFLVDHFLRLLVGGNDVPFIWFEVTDGESHAIWWRLDEDVLVTVIGFDLTNETATLRSEYWKVVIHRTDSPALKYSKL